MLTYRNIFLNCPSGVQGSVFGLRKASVDSSHSDPSRCPTFAWQFPPARGRCPAGWDRYLEPFGPVGPVYPGWTHGFEGLQQPKRKKDQKSMSRRWIFNEFTRNGSKWIQMNTRCWNMLEYFRLLHFGLTSSQTRQWTIRSIPIHAEIHGSMMIYDDPGHPWPAQSRSARVRLRRARTKKASGMKTKIVQSLWPGQNSEKPRRASET